MGSCKGLSRAEIEKKLQELERLPAPKQPSPFLMCCYFTPAPPRLAEYVCPICGNKTLYTDFKAGVVKWEVHAARRHIKFLQGVAGANLNLDESQFCRKCSPDAKNPELVLLIQYDDGETQKVAGISQEDLLLLTNFFSGKLVDEMDMSIMRLGMDYRERLRELLGLR